MDKKSGQPLISESQQSAATTYNTADAATDGGICVGLKNISKQWCIDQYDDMKKA